MSNLRLQGNPSGTGTLTIASPNTNSDFTLNLPASGGTFVVDGASQSPTFNAVTATSVATTTLAVAGNNISAVNSLGFRNRIINGDMRIDQRNGGAAVTVNNGFVWSVDRWGGEDGSDGAFTLQQSTTVPSTGGFVNSLQATVTTADTVPAAGQYAVLTQFIEGFNTSDFGWGTSGAVPVTVSCWVRASVAGTYSCTLYNNGASRINPQPLVINAANTWEYKTITFAGDTSGTWLTNNGRGVVFNIYLLLGTTGAAGWNGGTHFGVNGQANLLATVSNTFNITGVQLEAGSVATPFERRDYGRELIMCQRYYSKSYDVDVVPGTNAGYTQAFQSAGPTSSTGFYGTSKLLFPVRMRSAPTVSLWTYNGTAGQWHAGVNGVSETAYGASSGNINTAGFTVAMAGVNTSFNVAYGTWAASAEL